MYSRNIVLPRDESIFLLGPRGAGKTTLVRQKYPNALYLDLLEARVYNELVANPSRLDEIIPFNNKSPVILDEIQRIPELLHEVHRLIESHHYQFVLTGSSARKLRKSGVNLLAGRALTYNLLPLSAVELGKDFDFKKAVKYGLLPTTQTTKYPKKYLESYVNTYLTQEVKQEGLTRNIGAFARFLETISYSQGSLINTSEIAREAMIERKVVENYLSILEDLLVASRLPVFTHKSKRKLVSHNKFYFFDVGIYQTLRPSGPLNSPHEIEGIAWESLVWQNLNAIVSNLELDYNVFFWRTTHGVEVDFILYGNSGLIAIEVKHSDKVSLKDIRGLKTFYSEYPSAKCFVFYGGERERKIENIQILPIKQALQTLPQLLS
ncbi:MAG: ATP-binding protein [bacterium]|nr:ATP-binding protein [Candidatus Microgenomates bacterium CPR3]MCQ3944608.1 ATP-binding protein [bacterium]RIK52216.1 MAG: ATPase [Candidatus Microgenomates bacterium]